MPTVSQLLNAMERPADLTDAGYATPSSDPDVLSFHGPTVVAMDSDDSWRCVDCWAEEF